MNKINYRLLQFVAFQLSFHKGTSVWIQIINIYVKLLFKNDLIICIKI